MPRLPSGTVSLLFTDVEGSTQLQHRLGERYLQVVGEHRRLLEEAIKANRGRVVDRQTESFFAVFTRMGDAAQAAADAQRALATHEWPDGIAVKVRMGIHAGEPSIEGSRYVGLAVARAARVAASSHGGQVLLSAAARSLLGERKDGIRALGSFRLKDFHQPEPLYQLVVEDLPARFPPPRTARMRSRRNAAFVVAGALAGVGAAVAAAVTVMLGGADHPTRISSTGVGIIDPETNRIVDEIPLGERAPLVKAGPGFVWVAARDGNLAKIDTATRQVVRRSGISGPGVVTGLAIGFGRLWAGVARPERLEVLAFDLAFGQIDRAVTVAERGSPRGPPPFFSRERVLVAVGLGAIWAVEQRNGSLTRIDPSTGAKKVLAEGLGGAHSIAAGEGAVWLGEVNTVKRVDPDSGSVLAIVQVGQPTAAEVTALELGAGSLWFAASSRPTLWRIEPSTNAVRGTMAIGRGATAIAVGEEAVWVANSVDRSLTRVDPQNAIASTIPVGVSPGGVAVSQGFVWVTPGESVTSTGGITG